MINTFEQLLERCKEKTIWEVAEQAAPDIREYAKVSLDAMKEAIKAGLSSKEMSMSGMCGDDSNKLQERYNVKNALFGNVFEKIVEYAIATGEENIRMGKIAACPTAGSCGIVPSVIVAISEEKNISLKEQLNALITAGEVGRIIAQKVSPAGAVAGCQAECGTACAMAASAAAQLLGGRPLQVVNAVALALKNILGLTCDPVCGLVEVPCVKRNAFMAVSAITACELALAGIESKIPADEVIDAMDETGQLMSPMLKESSQGGLARTKTALLLKNKIFS